MSRSSASACVYADRVARRDRDYRDPDRAIAAGRSEGACGRAAHEVAPTTSSRSASPFMLFTTHKAPCRRCVPGVSRGAGASRPPQPLSGHTSTPCSRFSCPTSNRTTSRVLERRWIRGWPVLPSHQDVRTGDLRMPPFRRAPNCAIGPTVEEGCSTAIVPQVRTPRWSTLGGHRDRPQGRVYCARGQPGDLWRARVRSRPRAWLLSPSRKRILPLHGFLGTRHILVSEQPAARSQASLIFACRVAPLDLQVGGPAGAAARLGMKRTTLQSKIAKLGIQRPAVR